MSLDRNLFFCSKNLPGPTWSVSRTFFSFSWSFSITKFETLMSPSKFPDTFFACSCRVFVHKKDRKFRETVSLKGQWCWYLRCSRVSCSWPFWRWREWWRCSRRASPTAATATTGRRRRWSRTTPGNKNNFKFFVLLGMYSMQQLGFESRHPAKYCTVQCT